MHYEDIKEYLKQNLEIRLSIGNHFSEPCLFVDLLFGGEELDHDYIEIKDLNVSV